MTSPTRSALPAALDRAFAGVLFDMDGTLLSSVASVERSWATLAREHGIEGFTFHGFHGVPARRILEAVMPDRPAAEREAAFARVLELELSDLEGIEVLPGALEALAVLAPRGLCAVVTSSTRDLAVARLAAAGLPVPAAVVTADDVARGKPDPEPFVVGADRLGADVARCLVVEDAPAGVASGRAAGATTVGLLTTTDDLEADVVVADLAALRFSVDADGGVRVEAA